MKSLTNFNYWEVLVVGKACRKRRERKLSCEKFVECVEVETRVRENIVEGVKAETRVRGVIEGIERETPYTYIWLDDPVS